MDEFVKAALNWCNEMRVQRDMEPLEDLPKGVRGDPASCPCGTATGLFVGHQTFSDRENVIGTVPYNVHCFTLKFDSGDYPEYDEEFWGELV